ncbi:MAG: hypothetical protein AB7F40_10755 [Victivallaceae bacterium]|nr:hypothetical protein [Victivallaceae bacterium]
MTKSAIILSVVALLLAGCNGIDVNYTGESLPSVESSQLVSAAPVGAELLGKATATGPANLSRLKVENALLEKAREEGARYVVITDHQVVPNLAAGPVSRESSMTIWAENGAAVDNWTPLQRDFAGGYGTADLSPILGGSNPSNAQPIGSYERILQAEFYK